MQNNSKFKLNDRKFGEFIDDEPVNVINDDHLKHTLDKNGDITKDDKPHEIFEQHITEKEEFNPYSSHPPSNFGKFRSDISLKQTDLIKNHISSDNSSIPKMNMSQEVIDKYLNEDIEIDFDQADIIEDAIKRVRKQGNTVNRMVNTAGGRTGSYPIFIPRWLTRKASRNHSRLQTSRNR